MVYLKDTKISILERNGRLRHIWAHLVATAFMAPQLEILDFPSFHGIYV